MARGTFFLIVGPSGAGKDSLIRGAELALSDKESYVFAGRVITRKAESDREAHESVSSAEFAKREKAKAFMLTWRVYDTDYGIPASYNDFLNAGHHVVAGCGGRGRRAFQTGLCHSGDGAPTGARVPTQCPRRHR